jgi:hypothetical protein
MIYVVKYWKIITDNLSKAGWTWGCASALDSNGRTILVADGIVATVNASLCLLMKNSPRLWN